MSFLLMIPVVLIIVVSALIVKIASVALNLTGLDEKKAFFQALSAFTGTGFTTRDSEEIVNHDIRRKIIIFLMIMGNAGFISMVSTIVLSLMRSGSNLLLINVIAILLAVLLMIKVSLNKGFARKLTKRIQQKLIKSHTFTKRPVEEILRLAEGYGIAEVTLSDECLDIGNSLIESSFRQKDILVLAIERGATVLPAPHASDRLLSGDVLICYGKLDNISNLKKI